MEALLPLLLLAAFWLLMMRPQQQRVKRQRELLQSLAIGDDVVTVGGIVGHIVALDDDRVGLRVADGVVIEVVRGAIGQKIPDKTDGDREQEPQAIATATPPDDDEPQGH